ncbi:putative bifunctional diguanylate cyclase/phosphodiesterase [Vibrio salinus]|uniref:putative bifunctional diguanylate cyclase/phosphodiesterase n=1 Tax=Vibrio salinus TaxID=2899784 RepID=UPI001E2A2636|nr:bifunctional diguanylate cyclase/phosphodiesterase [Vibrio salinus]MCE0495278.1 bifunctional diguanylate cyclase/phosphodiesterase [Vibrio salinus]
MALLIKERDITTGLYRREAVLKKTEDFLHKEKNSSITLLLIEIHRFKQVNDGVGPLIGDKIIASIARRIAKASPKDAIVGRMGGDGFAIVLPTDSKVASTAEKIIELVQRPLSVGGNVVALDCSIGIAHSIEHAASAYELVRAADIALHLVAETKEKISVYKQEMLFKAESIHLLENDLRYSVVIEKVELIRALSSNEFQVYYQPQVSCESGNVEGVEALIRWMHPKRGSVSPEVFIPIAEKIGIIDLLGAWVLKKACKDIQIIRNICGQESISLSVNVSPKQLENMTFFIQQLENALADSSLPPDLLKLEITENAILRTSESEINRLLHQGVSLALDDFGTGFSSMTVMRSLPLESAKLDKTFVSSLFLEDTKSSQRDKEMIQAFVALCKALNIKSTIEGVETKEQAAYLASIGSHTLQGFYYSCPLSFSDLQYYLTDKGVTQYV